MINSIIVQRELEVSDFHTLDDETRSYILTKNISSDKDMRDRGQEAPVWDGPVPEDQVINHEVAARTEKGTIVGKAIYFGKIPDSSGVYKRSVYVYVPSSGSVWEVDSKNIRMATKEDFVRMTDEVKMARTLEAVDEKVKELIKTKRTKRVVGSHLIDDMLTTAKGMGLVIEDKSGFHKIFGNKKGVCVYLAKNGGRADLSNFCIDHHAVVGISQEEAKARHIGKVRGQVDFSRPTQDILNAWEAILKFLD